MSTMIGNCYWYFCQFYGRLASKKADANQRIDKQTMLLLLEYLAKLDEKCNNGKDREVWAETKKRVKLWRIRDKILIVIREMRAEYQKIVDVNTLPSAFWSLNKPLDVLDTLMKKLMVIK